MARRPVRKTAESRLTAVERGIKSLQANDAAIIKEMRDGFERMEGRFDQLYNHVDGFMKLHETADWDQSDPMRVQSKLPLDLARHLKN